MDRGDLNRCKYIKKKWIIKFFINLNSSQTKSFIISHNNNIPDMLQRIQSVYLVIVAIACILLFFFPLANYYNELQGNYKFFIYGIRSMDPEPKVLFGPYFTIPLIFLTVASFIFTVSAILLFKNRPLQIRLCAFNMITNIVLVMVIFFFYATRIKTLTMTEPEYNYTGMVLPLVSILFLILANQGIRKDEALVKSADRLR